jgi:hypothetical protein
VPFDNRGHELVELVGHVRKLGLDKEAAALLRDALQPAPKPPKDDSNPLGWHRQETKLGLDYWNISNMVQAAIDEGKASKDTAILDTLIESGESYLSQEYKGTSHRDSTWISSEGWDGEDRGYEDPLRIVLRGSYREAKRLLAAGVPRKNILDILARSKWSAFRRLFMKILSEDPANHLELAKSTIANADNYHDSSVRRDYAGLVAATKGLLSNQDKTTYCQLVEADINAETVREGLTEVFPGRQVTNEEVENLVNRERATRLAPLAGSLPEPWATTYEATVKKFGAPKFVHGPAEIGDGGFAIGAADLSGLTPAQVLEKIGQYDLEHEQARFDPLSHDLYRGLELAVSSRPLELATTDFCKKMPRGFHGAYLDGLQAALAKGALTAATALELAKLLTAAGTTENGRHELARLLEEVSKVEGASLEEMRAATTMLEGVASTGAPQDSDALGATETALNHPRTRALQILLRLIANTSGEKPKHADLAPELSAAIERVVAAWPAESPIVSAVLGEAAVNLWVADKPLLLRTANRHFLSSSEDERTYAWVAYVTWNRAFKEVLDPLMAAYEEGVQWTFADKPSARERHSSNYLEGLARHLTAIWYRGWGSPTLRQAIQAAPPHVVEAMLREFSIGLDATKAGEAPELIGRIGELIDHYVSRAAAGELKLDQLQSLSHICEKAGHFSPAIRMTWLSKMLAMPGYVHMDSDLIEAVLDCRVEAPEETSKALALLLPKSHFYALKDAIDRIQTALGAYAATGTAEQKARLAAMCDQLVQQGFTQFESSYYGLQADQE